jgi:hypothetical protein
MFPKGASRLYNKTCYIAKLYNLLEKRKKKCYITQCFITFFLFYNIFYVIHQLSVKIKRCFKTLFYNMFRLVHTGQHVIETFLRRLRFIIARNVINAIVFSCWPIFTRYLYRDIFLTLNIVHTYSLCSILKNTDQCIVSGYATNYTEHQRF